MSDSDKLTQLIHLISGNPADKQDDGLAGDVKQLKDKMIAMEKRDAKLVGIIIGLAVFAGAGVGQALEFLSKFL